MIDSVYEGKRFSLWLVDERGEHVVSGGWVAHVANGELMLVREGGRIAVDSEWLGRIRMVVNDAVRETLLGADYFVQLRVGSVSGQEVESMLATGIRWPD